MKKQKGVIDIAMGIGIAVLVTFMSIQHGLVKPLNQPTGQGTYTPNHDPDMYKTEEK